MTTDGSCTAFQRRPFLKDFLEAVCPLYEVAVFTAGSRVRPPFPHAPTPAHLASIAMCEFQCRRAHGWQLAGSSLQALLMMDEHAQSVH